MAYDENKIFREVTLRVTGKLDIEEALVDIRSYLSTLMPIDEVLLFRMDEDKRWVHLVMRVTHDGVKGEPEQLLFMFDKKNYTFTEERFAPQQNYPHIFTLSDIKEFEVAEQGFAEFGIPPSSDVLLLFNPTLSAGIVAVSYQKDIYQEQHIQLFELLREPFSIVLSNALQYIKVQKKRDTLANDNLIFREATVRLTGEHDIVKAFQNTLIYLRQFLPLDHIILITLNDQATVQRTLFRVSEQTRVSPFLGRRRPQKGEGAISSDRQAMPLL